MGATPRSPIGSTAKKTLRREQRQAEAAIVREHQPEDFGAWLHQRRERGQAVLQRLEALFKQRQTVRHVINEAPAQAQMPAEDQRLTAADRARRQQTQASASMLISRVRQSLRDAGVADRDLPSHAELAAQLPGLRKSAAAMRREGHVLTPESEIIANLLRVRGQSQRPGGDEAMIPLHDIIGRVIADSKRWKHVRAQEPSATHAPGIRCGEHDVQSRP
jgi:hypothetical protein